MDVEALSRGTEVGYLERPARRRGRHGRRPRARGGRARAPSTGRGRTPTWRSSSSATRRAYAPFIDEPLPSHVRIVQASETVGMDEPPAVAVRRKRDASINVAMRLVRDGEADAVVTAGHTGAAVASAILHLKRLPGVDRPALAVQMITDSGPLILLDIGATTDSPRASTWPSTHTWARSSASACWASRSPGWRSCPSARNRARATSASRTPRPCSRTATFGSWATWRAATCPTTPRTSSSATPPSATSSMKFFEGLSTVMFEMLRKEFQRPPWGPLGYLFMRPGIKRIRARFDYEKLGGAPLLGRQRHGPHHARPRQAPHDRATPSRSPPWQPGRASPSASHGHARSPKVPTAPRPCAGRRPCTRSRRPRLRSPRPPPRSPRRLATSLATVTAERDEAAGSA